MSWNMFQSASLATWFTLAAISPAHADEPKPTISVSGSAEIRVVPDQVVITAAVESRAKEVATACKDNETRIRAIVQFLKSSGIEDKHIHTEYIAIDPIMRLRSYPRKAVQAQANLPNSNPFEETEEEQLEQPVGYLARRQFAITVVDLGKFEAIYQGLIERGINRVSGIEFRTSKLREHRDEARLKAVRAAKEKAQAMAGELGATLFAIKSIDESRDTLARTAMQNSISNPFGGEPAEGTFAIGQIEINAAVDVVFYLGSPELDD